MPCKASPLKFGLWLAIAIGIATATMPSGKPSRPGRPVAAPDPAVPRVTLVFPLN